MVSPRLTRDDLERARRRLALRGVAARTPTRPTAVQPQPAPSGGFLSSAADAFRAVTPQGFRDVAGRGLREVGGFIAAADKPLSERAGLRIPDLPGPFDEAGNFILQEATRPSTLAIALGGAGLAGKLATSGVRGAGFAAQLVAPVGGRTLAARTLGETALAVGGRAGGEVGVRATEGFPTPIRVTAALAGGLVGGLGALGATRSGVRTALKRDILAPIPIRITPPTPEAGVRRGNLLRAKTPEQLPRAFTEVDVLKIGRDIARQSTSQQARLAATVSALMDRIGKRTKGADGNIRFENIRDKGGQAALAQDVLENPTRYSLTAEQQRAVQEYSETAQLLTRERELFDVPVDPTKLQIGQNFIPRRALEDTKGNLLDATRSVIRGGRRLSGSTDKARRFRDPLLAVDSGIVYKDPVDSFIDFARQSFKEIEDTHIASLLKPLSSTSADRLSRKLVKRVNSLRARVSGRVKTLAAQRVRAAERGVTTKQAGREAERASARAEKARGRAEALSPDEIVEVRRSVEQIITDGRLVAREAGENIERLRQANRISKSEATAIEKVIRAFEAEAAKLTSGAKLATLERRLDKALDRLTKRAEKIGERVEQLTERGLILKDLDAKARVEFVQERRFERQISVQQRQLASATIELRALERAEKRAAGQALTAVQRAARTEEAAVATESTLAKLREDLGQLQITFDAAKAQARITPTGFETIPSSVAPLLTGRAFKSDSAKRIASYYSQGTILPNQTGAVLRKIQGINRAIVPMRSIGDASAVLNQLGLFLPTNPRTFVKNLFLAFRDSVNMKNYERFLVEQGQDAAAHGVVILGRAGERTEFEFGSWVQRVPGLKQTQQHFQAVTTRNRIDVYNSLVDIAARQGKVLDDAAKDEIARSMNRLSGISNSRAGDFETLVQFAPNFLRSSIETLNAAVRNGSIEGQLARQYLRNFVLAGQFATIAGAMGIIPGIEERDLRDVLSPIDVKALKRGELRMNGNFGTIRTFGQDISVYGRFDSLARLVLVTADASVRAISERDVTQLADAIGFAARTKGSPFVSTITNALLGSTFGGASPFSLEGLSDQVIPFALSDFIDDVRRGLPPETSAAGGLVSFFGGKANPQTPFEQLNEVAQEVFGRPWDELVGTERQQLEDELPKLVSRSKTETRRRADGGDTRSLARVLNDESTDRRLVRETELMGDLQTGQITRKDFSDAMDESQRDASVERDQTFRALGIEFSDPTTPAGLALAAFYETYDLATRPSGVIDWDLREQLENELLLRISNGEFGDPEQTLRVITERKRAQHAPEVQWYFDAKTIISNSGYYTIRDVAFERFSARVSTLAGERVDSYGRLIVLIDGAIRTSDLVLERGLNRLKLAIDRIVNPQRERLRRQNPALQSALVSLGKITR